MIAATITPPQIKRLQILYAQFEAHSLDCPGAERTDRLSWASKATGRTITSFKGLTRDEAIRLIDGLQRSLGTKAPNKSPRRRVTGKDAQKMGTEGRRDQQHDEITLAGPSDVSRLQRDMARLGWDEARLEAFLRSSRSPLNGTTKLTTLGHYNRLHYALKSMATQQQHARS